MDQAVQSQMPISPEKATFLLLKRALPEFAPKVTAALSPAPGYVSISAGAETLTIALHVALLIIGERDISDRIVSLATSAKSRPDDIEVCYRASLGMIERLLQDGRNSPEIRSALQVMQGALICALHFSSVDQAA